MKQQMQLNIKQTQQLILTQELRQSIEMLQLNKQELIEFIYKQLEENPMLEAESTDDFESVENIQEEFSENLDYLQSLESFNSEPYQRAAEDKDYEILHAQSTQRSLYAELSEQLHSIRLSKKEYEIGEFILLNIDKNGYLEEKLSIIANRCSVSVPFVEEVLAIIQSFEPKGIAARDLKECLLLQVEDRKLAKEIIDQHLELIGKNKIDEVATKMQLSKDDVNEEIEFIKSLNPKPGASYFSKDSIDYIIPDARIEKENERYQVTLLNQHIPTLYISASYLKLMKNSGNKETLRFLNKKLSSAKYLINAILQRQSTIQKILEEIIKDQELFFQKGVRYLKPVFQKDVASRIGVSDSTVSRASMNKYVETPQGIFKIKYFFSSSLKTDLGEQVSDKAVKEILLDIVADEDKKKPLSDQKLKVELEKEGILISRRTVQKYRDELGILNSSLRKTF